MLNNRWWAFPGAFLLIALSGNNMPAQMTTGSISGTVMDASEAVIQGADITAINQGTRATRKSVSGVSGGFLFSAMPPGVYDISVTKTGFREFKITGIALSASQRLSSPSGFLLLAPIG